MGVGYVIGPRIAGTMVAGGVLSWLVLLPLLSLLGAAITDAVPADSSELREQPGHRPAVPASRRWAPARSGAPTSATSAPARCSRRASSPWAARCRRSSASAREGLKGFGAAARRRAAAHRARHAADGRARRLAAAGHLPRRHARACRRRATSWSSILIVLFGFFFATVSSRITGLIGSSSNPISGMTIATLIITCVIFVALGWTGDVYGADRAVGRRHRLHRRRQRRQHLAGPEDRLHRRRHADLPADGPGDRRGHLVVRHRHDGALHAPRVRHRLGRRRRRRRRR